MTETKKSIKKTPTVSNKYNKKTKSSSHSKKTISHYYLPTGLLDINGGKNTRKKRTKKNKSRKI